MAIKISNQITFTEHKKIIEIKEWYLATSEDSGVTNETAEWSTDIPMMNSVDRYLWNYEETIYSLGSSDVTAPVIIGVYGEVGTSLQVKYISSITTPVIINNDVSAWSDIMPAPKDGYNVYMTQKLSNQDDWSTPIQISGSTTTTEIIDGYWYINGDPTGVKAEGSTPEITIGKDGYWYIDGKPTDSKAQGDTGKDGASIEYVYYLSETEKELQAPYYSNNQLMPSGWSESPKGITATYKYEYVSVRTKSVGGEWSNFSQPVIWSAWGKKGQDGDGVAYEYYLCNEPDVTKIPAWSENNSNWKDDPQGVSATYKYEYVVQLTIKTAEDGTKTTIASSPSLWAKYGETGASLQIKYINSATVPTIINNNVTNWLDYVPVPKQGEKTYMTQKLSTEINWSTPIQISGTDGEANISINDDGYWVINGEATDVQAKGETPKIEINKDGYWVINDSATNIKAEGKAGEDGADIEFVYYIGGSTKPSTPYYSGSTLYPDGWKKSPQGVTANTNEQYEYVSVRHKAAGTNMTWGSFSAPVVWSKWGEKGQDGDGVEYKYCLWNSSTTKPSYPAPSGVTYKWYDDPQGVTSTQQYEYVVQIKTTVVNGVTTTTTSAVSLWAKYGADGKGIVKINNYYATTKTTDAPTANDWQLNKPKNNLSPEYKYLWNYEEIQYTTGSPTTTDPAIIGAYGDSGTDAVDFQIYSVDGFEFSDSVVSITLKTVAVQGGSVINSGATYKWYWWNSFSSSTDKYEVISGATSSSLVVNSTDAYALAGLKCVMTYDGMTYTDYVTLTEKTILYTTAVKFFDGSNIFTSNDLYLVAYLELYKNNERVESALDYANTYWPGVSTVSSSGVITSDIKGNFTNGDTMYFICQNEDLYDVILGQYTSNTWKKVSYNCNYTYTNSLYSNIKLNVIAISKESINKSKNVDFVVYDGSTILSRTNVNIIDSNDPIIGSEEPKNPVNNQLWLNTSVTPNVLKIYDQSTGKWIECVDYTGNTIYTSKPSSYSKGDLWILADGEVCGSFGPGSMLKATTSSDSFNASHWIDADSSLTSLKENIKQYFEFNATTGLKIGQKDENFYVNISSTEMGFYDNSTKQNKKVVYISNETANIDGLTVEKNLDVDCPATFNDEVNFFGFVWKKESDGSLSLAIG